MHYKNSNQLIELIKFNLSKIIPDDNKLLSIFLSPNDFDNYGSLIKEKLPHKISPHSEISNGAIRIKLDENQYEDNFHSNLLSIAKDILSRDDFEKYKEEKSNISQTFDKPKLEAIDRNFKNEVNKISGNRNGNLKEDNLTSGDKAADDDKSETEEVVKNVNSKDNSNLEQIDGNLKEDNPTLGEKAVDDDKSELEEVVKNANISINSGLSQKISIDNNSHSESNNENFNESDLEKLRKIQIIKFLIMIITNLRKNFFHFFFKAFLVF